MIIRFVYSVLLTGLGLLVFASYSSAETPKTDKVKMLFVQSTTSGSSDGKTLTLNGVPSTLYFSDRPKRIAGHMQTDSFVAEWAKGKDSFESNPPNAVLSVISESGVIDSTVELSNPQLKGNQISYQLKVLDGTPPTQFKSASLFIDGHGGAFIGGMVAGHVLHNVRENTEFRRAAEGR